MKSMRDWVFSQVVSSSLVLSRPLSGSGSYSDEDPQNEVSAIQDSNESVSVVASQVPADITRVQNSSHETQPDSPAQEVLAEGSSRSNDGTSSKKLDPLSKIEALQVKFLRILRRLGQSPEDLLVSKVLYRIHLATLIRTEEPDLKRVTLKIDKATVVAEEQDAAGHPVLDFSLKILVIGKTGVGKSATINSLFHQTKAFTDAFRPATDHIEEVTGTVNGVRITVVDTPGFWPYSTGNLKRNRKIMRAIKRHIRKAPPDIVLYLERLDVMNRGHSEFPLLRLITEVFGSAIWFNTILVMTHAASALPEGPNGFPVSYESYVKHCSDLLQHYVHQAVSDSKLEIPVVLVENHPKCRTNIFGEKILPNGQAWRSQLLLLCVCSKALGDANSLLGFQDSIELGPTNSTRLPSLPHLLSALLRQRSVTSPDGADDEIDEDLFSDTEEDEYDQLPPIRILTKSQFEKLSDSHKQDYLDELDYRETLFLKKQLKEEKRKRRERKLLGERNYKNGEHSDDSEASPEAVPLPDMAVPPNFDSDCPLHRYRGLVTSDQWLWRPVLDPHGWDHDVGFDGINLETAVEIKRSVTASISGQMSKDKQDFTLQSEFAAAYADPRGPTYIIGVDVQSAGNDLIYTAHSNAKSSIVKHNVAGCGVSVTSFRDKNYIGAKIEDAILIGKRLKFVVNAGQMRGLGQVANGGTLEATLRGRDYPVRDDRVSMTMTVLSCNKEMVLGGSIQSEFRPSRGMKVSVDANVNSRRMGKITVKTSSSEHIEIAFVAIFSIFRALCRRKTTDNLLNESQEVG